MGIIVDVSHWEELIDWPRAQAAGVTDAIFKLTHGRHGGDPYALRNWLECGKIGIRRATFMWPVPSEENPILQVRNYVQFLRALGWDPAIDWFAATDFEERYELEAAFAYATQHELEQQLQVTPWIYSNVGTWDELIGRVDWAAHFPLWVAHHTSAPAPLIPLGWTIYELWQYTRRGTVPGIKGGTASVDLNRLPPPVTDPTGALYRVAVIAGVTLNIRSGPGIEFAKTGHLVGGQQVDVYDELDIWQRISPTSGAPAWVSSRYTKRIP